MRNGQCDGQHKVVLDHFGMTYDEHAESQNGIGQLALYHPAVRKAIVCEGVLTSEEAKLYLPKLPQALQEKLELATPLGTDWCPAPQAVTDELLASLQARTTCQSQGLALD